MSYEIPLINAKIRSHLGGRSIHYVRLSVKSFVNLCECLAPTKYRNCFTGAELIKYAMKPNWEHNFIFTIAAAAILYLGIVFFSGADKFGSAIAQLPIWLIPCLLLLVFFGYCIRFLRWQWYLQRMGYKVNIASSFRIFLAGFALTASPGKAGESIKSILLKRSHDVPISPTLAALFCERFTDALSVVLLIGLGLSVGVKGHWTIALVAGLQIAIVVLLQRPAILRKFLFVPLKNVPKLGNIVAKIDVMLDSARQLLELKILIGATFLALVAWSLEGIALYIIFQYLGATSVTLSQAILIHTSAGLLGALSFLPGGIGTTEGLTISFSMVYGASQTAAIAATLLIRPLTLWFAVAIGIIALLSCQKNGRSRPNALDSDDEERERQ